jgi:hypothetical protein
MTEATTVFSITLASGETRKLPAPPYADLVAFERRFRKPSATLAVEQYAEEIAFLCWLQLRRLAPSSTPGEFEPFLEQVAGIVYGAQPDGAGEQVPGEVTNEGEAAPASEPAP